ncbi:MAG: hypothetical protein QOC99_1438 [Acidobacteriota bacterium]|jgi:hypothetical protein|nr:hypothetical protein [Acidobacteriota bacterium]
MIDVKQATQSASGFLVGLYPNQSVSSVRLEEIELTEDEKSWLITLSFPDSDPPSSNFHLGLAVGTNRQYKVFEVDAETGQVKSMKIREI